MCPGGSAASPCTDGALTCSLTRPPPPPPRAPSANWTPSTAPLRSTPLSIAPFLHCPPARPTDRPTDQRCTPLLAVANRHVKGARPECGKVAFFFVTVRQMDAFNVSGAASSSEWRRPSLPHRVTLRVTLRVTARFTLRVTI